MYNLTPAVIFSQLWKRGEYLGRNIAFDITQRLKAGETLFYNGWKLKANKKRTRFYIFSPLTQ